MTADQRATRFSVLYERYVPVVRAYVRTKVSTADVESVVQMTFETAWSKLEAVPLLSEKSWLFGVARNHMRNLFRGNRRRGNLVDAISASRPKTDTDLYANDLDPAELDRLRHALEQLAEIDREIVQLTVWHGFDSTEVAHILEISAANVRVRLHRARQKLATLLLAGSGEVA